MKSIILWFFDNKNRFVALVFFMFVTTVIGFALVYWSLIVIDSKKRRNVIPHFVINPEVVSEKMKQNKFELIDKIEEDSIKLQYTNAQLIKSYYQLPRALLTYITTRRDSQFYLNELTASQMHKYINVNQWPAYPKRVEYKPDGTAIITTRQLLNKYIIGEHELVISPKGLILSFVSARNEKDSLTLSQRILNGDDETAAPYLRSRSREVLISWVFRKYKNAIAWQFLTTARTTQPLQQDKRLRNYEETCNQQKDLEEALGDNRRDLREITRPDWSFLDIVFFTVVSLFANNYSDIYPNSTMARFFIMSEFIVVWFLTICAISLEPDKFGFVKRLKNP